MGQVGADVAVDQDDLTFVQSGFNFRLGFEAVTGIEQRGEMGVDSFKGAEFAIEKLADHFAEPGIVLRESSGVDAAPASLEYLCEQVELGALAAAVDAFDGDQAATGPFVFC